MVKSAWVSPHGSEIDDIAHLLQFGHGTADWLLPLCLMSMAPTGLKFVPLPQAWRPMASWSTGLADLRFASP